jgi:hypothetical protein
MEDRERLRNRILEYLRLQEANADATTRFGIADFHANAMKALFPSEEGTPQRTFSPRALMDEALDELAAEGFVEVRENGRYFLTEKGRGPAAR